MPAVVYCDAAGLPAGCTPDPSLPLYHLPANTGGALASVLAADWPYAIGLAVVVWALLIVIRHLQDAA